MKILFKFLFVFIFFNLFSSQPDYSYSVVKVLVTKQQYSYEVPWQAPSQCLCSGSGFLIEDGYIFTNAHVVANAATIHVQKNKESIPYDATIEYVDHDCDLAVLKVVDKSFYNEMKPLELADEVFIGEKLRVVGFPMEGINLCLTEGITSREERYRYGHSGKEFDVIQIDSTVNGGNSGGPAISQKEGKVLGVVHQAAETGQNVNHIIPIRMVKHFIKEINEQAYFGFPELGLEIQPLLNPSLQKYLGLKDDKCGVLIKSIDFGSCVEGILFPGDILIEVDGYQIRNDGTIKVNGKVRNLASFLSDKFYQEKIKGVVLRDEKKLFLEIPIIKSKELEQSLVPLKQYDCKPTYFVLGGIVFQPLNENFLHHFYINHGYIPADLRYYYCYGKKSEDKTEVIFINRVLSDGINFGYGNLALSIISEVNGQKIKNMKDLVSIIDDTKEDYYIITTEKGEKIILDKKEVKERQKNIFNKYELDSDRSDDLKPNKQFNWLSFFRGNA